MKTGIVICSYNMPEYTDALVEHIRSTVYHPYELVVVDNGSKIDRSEYTTHRLTENIQMVPGFLYGLDQLGECDAYWLLTTSVRFRTLVALVDPLEVLLPIFENDPLAYAIQPATIFYPDSAWKELLEPRSIPVPRRVWATDYACTLYRTCMFDELGRWNKNLTMGWGVGSENFYLARKAGYHIYSHDGYVMYHDQGIGYSMDRMGVPSDYRAMVAKAECDAEFIPKYGEDYLEVLNWAYRETGRGEY